MKELYGRNPTKLRLPIVADKCKINWGGIVTGAIQVQISYSVPTTRKRTIGNYDAVIYAGQPNGQITIARLLTVDGEALFAAPGWDICKPGEISVTMGGGCDQAAGYTLTATGVIVSSFTLSMEAEGVTVADNVTIDFLQLFTDGTGSLAAPGAQTTIG